MTFKIPISTLLFATSVPIAGMQTSAIAQITANPNDAGTIVNQNGNTINIEGGTQTGANLFHSFKTLDLNQNQTANFISNPAIQNILGRVTGGDASVINGIIKVTGGNSNLYLMNPAGIIFGAGASLNVPAAFTATTANGIGFGDTWFNAVGANNYASLLGNPNGFAFTQAGTIFNGGNLAVGSGQNLTLLGGTVVSTGTISAPGGNITIAAIPGEQLVRITPEGSLLSLALPLETKAAINNTQTLTPLTLPQLLTGGNISGATGVTVENGVVKLTGADVNIGSGDVVVSTTGDITATYISANNGSIHLNTTGGDIKLGNPHDLPTSDNIDTSIVAKNTLSATAKGTIQAFSQLRGNSVKLLSTGGDVIITTIDAGVDGVDINAAGLFQARGAFTVTGGIFPTIKPSKDTELSQFLQERGIKFDPDKDINVISFNPTDPSQPLPVASIRTKPDLTKPDVNPQAQITIRYGGATRTIVDKTFDIPIQTAAIDDEGLTTITTIITKGKIFIQGGNSSYYTGPAVSGKLLPDVDDPYITNVAGKFVQVTPQTFADLYPNATYSTTFPSDKFPIDGNGTVGALIVAGGGNNKFYDSVQTRSFPQQPIVTPPIVTPPIVTPPIVTPPIVTPPIVTPPIVTPPIVTPPIVTPPIVTPPIVTPPTVTQPTVTQPIVTQPTVTQPTVTQPTVTQPTQPEEPSKINPPEEPSKINPSIDSDACNTSNTIAVNPQTTNGTNRDSSSRIATSSPSGSNNGCTPANNDPGILKILYETPDSGQNKQLNFDNSHPKFLGIYKRKSGN